MVLHGDEAASTLPHTFTICRYLPDLTVDASQAITLNYHGHGSHHAENRPKWNLVIESNNKRLIFSLVHHSAYLTPDLWATPARTRT